MVRINLLPWRAQLREERRHEFFVIAAAVVAVTCFCMVIVHLVLLERLHIQMGRDNYLQDQIAQLDVKIQRVKAIQEKKEQLIARIHIIEQLELRREIVVRMFAEMAKIIPDGLYITSVKKVDNKIVVTGKAESNTRVSEFMRNIEKSPWVTKPILTEIKDNDSNTQTRDFSLEMEQRSDLPSLTSVQSTPVPKAPALSTPVSQSPGKSGVLSNTQLTPAEAPNGH